ncbi:hypothetical protein LSH36_995g01050, partial [Paralvinella palmiformis]
MCSNDYDCPKDNKCCSNGCGHACKQPVRPLQKPGKCPALRKGVMGICVHLCKDDYDCPNDLKCCSTGCGHTCIN